MRYDQDAPDDGVNAGGWTAGAGGGWEGSANRWDDDDGSAPDGGWDDWDGPMDAAAGSGLSLPPRAWVRWRRRPWFPRVTRMVRGARPAGTLRHRRSGARYPVFRGHMGGRSFRMLARPRGGRRFEVMSMEAETGGEGELLSMMPPPGGEYPAPATGYRLRLPHTGLHAILGRLQPDQLRRLAGGRLPADPAAAVARGVGRVARRARRLGRFQSAGAPLDVFATPGFRLLVRPLGELEGEILSVAAVEGEEEGETPKRSFTAILEWWGPYTLSRTGAAVLAGTPGQKLPPLSGPGIYLCEKKQPDGSWRPVYVGKADHFARRLSTRREYLRQLDVDVAPYRVYLGVPGDRSVPLEALEHAVVRSVLRGWHRRGAAADPARATAAGIPYAPLTNLSPRAAFQVAAGGLGFTQTTAAGQSRPAYLRTGTGAAGQWYEVSE
ncbi:MAG TPA: hypothetical protein VGB92_02700 [Longimicrobium sp.]|jgi:hypothetical protein